MNFNNYKYFLQKDNNIVLLFNSAHESKHALNVKYKNEWYRVVYKDGYVQVVEPIPISDDYNFELPDNDILEGMFELVEEFFDKNPDLKGWE